MGIRVHKCVGWGTQKFTAPEDFFDRIETLWEMSPRRLLTWCKKHRSQIDAFYPEKSESQLKMAWGLFEVSMQDMKKEKHHASEVVSFDPEFGFENSILFSPLEMIKQTKRYDDLIDWLEERDHAEPRWEWLNRGIYPFDKGDLPITVVGVCLFLGITEVIPELKEALYVYWS